MKKFDIFIIIIILLGISITLYLNLNTKDIESKTLVIYLNNEIYKEVPLTSETSMEIPINSSYGYNLIKIENGVVSMEDSDCNNKICINSSEIENVSETIVCLPHKLVLKIQGLDESSDVDSVAK
ncbi:MAG: NusG domain II-containing protein [Clostridiaceae bacterium]